MIIGTLMALETCLILGQVSHNFSLLEETAPDGYMWSGRRLTRKQAYIQARSSMARVMEVNGEACEAEGKSKSGLRKRFILKTQENCVESVSSTPRIREFKETIKNARKKLETSVAPAMPL